MSTLPRIIGSLLPSLRSHPQLPEHSWYFITATTLCIINRPDEIPPLYKFALDHISESRGEQALVEEQLNVSRRIREALIKAAAVGGVPKTINALLCLKEVTPEYLQDTPGTDSPSSRREDIYNASTGNILQRGQEFFNGIYGKVSKRIMVQMDRSGTEDLGLTARLVYGYILSNTKILTPAETSFVLIAGLIPQDVNPQLKGHLRGALNGGATIGEVKAVRAVVIKICEAYGMKQLDAAASAGWGWRESVEDL